MFKLLTEETKTEVLSEYKKRRNIVIFTFLWLIFLIVLIGLVPSYIISIFREKDATARMEALSKSLTASPDNLDTLVKDLNGKLRLFSPSQDSDKPYESYLKIIELRPTGIRLNSFEYRRSAKDINLAITGIAEDRKALVDFQNNLNGSKVFSNVNIPVSDLAKDKNIEFHLTLSPKK